MKWIVIILLITTIMLVARGLSQQYKDKHLFYVNLQSFFKQLKLNLSFKQDKIENFIDAFEADNQFKSFLNCYKLFLQGNENAFEGFKVIDSNEIVELNQMMKSIGCHDTKSEIEQLDSFIERINLKLEKTREDKQKLCPLIIKLSLLFAIAVGILLI